MIYVADFETTKSIPTRVWLWCCVDEEENIVSGENIDSFFKYIYKMKSGTIIYFHNLKFDGTFIIVEAHKRGYSIVKEFTKEENEISALISDMGQYYTVTLSFKTVENKKIKYKEIKIVDSLKKINSSVENIAKDFEVGTTKGECDHNKARPVGYHATPEELDYCATDCIIVMRALKKLFAEDAEFYKRLTVGSAAFHSYKKPYGKYGFRDTFPLLSYECDKFIRSAYKGGRAYLNPKYKGTVQPAYVYDINSMYPFIMVNYPLPYGEPEYFEGEPTRDDCLFVVRLSCDFELKEGCHPSIQLKNQLGFNPIEYVSSSDFKTPILTLTNIDLEVFFRNYEVFNIEWYGGYYFRSKKGMFDDYIFSNIKIKQESKGAKRQVAKIKLNSLYGKFGTNPRRRSKEVYVENNTIKYRYSGYEEIESIYVAVAVFVTAYGRRYIQDAADKCGDDFIYCDTDSLHSAKPVEGIWIDSKELGAYKFEGYFPQSKFLRAKCYVEIDEDGNADFKVAGASDEVKQKMNLETFEIGSKFEGKLQAKQVEGGTLLVETTFQLQL